MLTLGVRALSTYCQLRPSSGKKGYPPIGIGPLGCRRSRDFVPALESLGQDVAIGGGREPVASRSEMLGNGTIRGEEPLRLHGRLEPLHPPLPLAGGLMGVLRAVIEIPVLAVLHAGQDLPLGRTIAFELVRDDHPRHILAALEQLAEEFLGRVLIPPALD